MADNLKKLLDLADKTSFQEAVKTVPLTQAESEELVDLMIERATKRKWDSKPTLHDVIERFDDMETQVDEMLDRVIRALVKQQEIFQKLLDGFEQFIDLCHPGAPENNRRDAGATVGATHASPECQAGKPGPHGATMALVSQKVRQLRPKGVGRGGPAGPPTDGDCPRAG